MIKFNRINCLVALAFLISAVSCDVQWYDAADGNSYLIDARYNYNWYDALVACTSRNLSLVTISSEAKNKALIDVLKDSGKDHYWIGAVANAASDKRNFYWINDGEQLDYTYWWVGEPNGGSNENCVHIDAYDYHWNDNNCASNKFALLCEQRPQEIEILNEIKEFRSFFFNINHELISQMQNVKNEIANLLSSVVAKAQQQQKEVEEMLPEEYYK